VDHHDPQVLVLDEQRERVRGLRVGEVDVGIAHTHVDVEDPVVLLRQGERAPQQEVAHGLRVLARLAPLLGAPPLVRGRGVGPQTTLLRGNRWGRPLRGRPHLRPYGPVTEDTSIAYLAAANAIASAFRCSTSLLLLA
jgi:hypothetical protein